MQKQDPIEKLHDSQHDPLLLWSFLLLFLLYCTYNYKAHFHDASIVLIGMSGQNRVRLIRSRSWNSQAFPKVKLYEVISLSPLIKSGTESIMRCGKLIAI